MPGLAPTAWLNGAPVPDATGPLLVHFWSVSCHTCHENMPTIAAWREELAPAGLRVVAIHIPRSAADLDDAKIRGQVESLGIAEPVGLDHRLTTAEAFQNAFVPSYYLFDAAGQLRSRTGGQAGLAMMRAALDRVLQPATR